MRPTQTLLGGGGDAPVGKYNRFIGGWGNFGGQKQKGIITYGIAPNRQRVLAGAAHAAVFNTWRRFRAQVLYVVPPFVAAYYAMEWAIKRNEYLYSKEGRHELEA